MIFGSRGEENEREKSMLKIKTENGSQLINLCDLEIQDAKKFKNPQGCLVKTHPNQTVLN